MRRVAQRKPLQVALIAAAVLGAAWFLRIADPPFLQIAREATFDQFQRLSPRAPPEGLPVRVVDIDEELVRRYGQWPWPRTMLAEMVDRLSQMGAAVVAFDMAFSEPDRTDPAVLVERLLAREGGVDPVLRDRLAALPDNDDALARSLAGQASVLGFFATSQANAARPRRTAAFAIAGDDPGPALIHMRGTIASLPELEASAAGVGSISLSGGRTSDVVRRVPLFLSDGEGIYPALAIEALRVATGASTYVLRSSTASGEAGGNIPAMVAAKVADFEVPTTAAGEMQLYFRPDDPGERIAAGRLMDGDWAEVAPLVEGHIVFVGASAVGLADLRVTALGETLPGVALHAQLVEQILSGAFLSRPDWADGAELAMTTAVVVLMAAVLPMSSALMAAVFGSVCAAVVAAISWGAFRSHGVLIEPLLAMLTGGAVYIFAITLTFAASERERRFVRAAFQHYLSPALVAKLEAEPGQLVLGGEVRNMTVLFMDVRDFTGIAERLPPTEVVSFLNRLFTPLSEIIQAHEGAIDKYIGDSVMAFWNAPLMVADHPRKACLAALEMVAAVEALNRDDAFGFRRRKAGIDGIRIGVGLATGDACVGNMGSTGRFNYSAIGDTVNVASRIEGETKASGFPILVSEATAHAAASMAFLPMGDPVLKGKSQGTAVYALAGDEALAGTPAFARLLGEHDRLQAALAQGLSAEAAAAAARCLALAPAMIAPVYRELAGGAGPVAAEPVSGA